MTLRVRVYLTQMAQATKAKCRAFSLSLACVAALVLAGVPNFAAAQSLVRDAEIEATLREYSDPIFVAAGLTPKDVKIYIVGDRTLNAFVTNGQMFFCTRALSLRPKRQTSSKALLPTRQAILLAATWRDQMPIFVPL